MREATCGVVRTGVSRRTVLGAAASGGALAAFAAPARAGAHALAVRSPDGRLTAYLDAQDGPVWSVRHEGGSLLERSPLGLYLRDGSLLGPGSVCEAHEVRAIDQTWTPPYGIRARAGGAANELVATFRDAARRIRFAIRLCVSNDGVAVRYRLLDVPGGSIVLSGEATAFRLPADAQLYGSRDEGEYQRCGQTRLAPIAHPPVTTSADRGALSDVPVTVTIGALTLAILESDRHDYPRMMLESGPLGMTTHLMRFPGRATSPLGDVAVAEERDFTVMLPFDTPWRVLLVGDRPADLIARQDWIPTLAAANRLGDTGWIRPGRAFRIATYTTQAAMAGIEFAVSRKLDYVEFDWHWYGDGTDDSDATVPIAGLDMQAIVAYGRRVGVGVVVYVDRVPATRQLEAICRTYQAWGIAGIKFGFIWEGRQVDTVFIERLVRLCGEHRLLVNLHDDLRPAGLERAYPNYVAMEGVRGNEQFPTARHNVTLPFTRGLAGPMDYTICYGEPRSKVSNAQQLAMAVVYYNPLTFLYWYADDPAAFAARALPGVTFFDQCPTHWDETHALAGAIGEYVAVARRHGARWFIGAMTDGTARTLDVKLDFLGDGTWSVERFADGKAASAPRDTPVMIDRITVTSSTVLALALAPSGGQALILSRV